MAKAEPDFLGVPQQVVRPGPRREGIDRYNTALMHRGCHVITYAPPQGGICVENLPGETGIG